MSVQSQIKGLLEIKKAQDRYEFRSDPQRLDAQHKWIVEAIEVLLQHALEQRGDNK